MKHSKTPIMFVILNVIAVMLLFYLPYYLFEGKLFLGGDDTRLLYAYPSNVLTSLSLFSWNTISSLPSYLPNHQFLPLLGILTAFEFLTRSKIFIFYFSFSLPFVLGYIYFRKFILLLLEKEYLISFTASLIYILSPITIVSQMFNFLTPMWLVGLFPILAYYYLAYMKSSNILLVIQMVIWSIILSFAYYTIPWILGLLLPLLCGLIVTVIATKYRFKHIIGKTSIFLSGIFFSQLFWFIPFISSLVFKGDNDLGGKLASKYLTDSFSPTVLATATGNIIYPLLTLYHRTIAFNYDWKLKGVFNTYYDHVLPLSLIFIVIVLLGLVSARRSFKGRFIDKYIFITASFIASLYFFTVNIGPLKPLFLVFRFIPGFSIFRNFTDKFALGYIFIYSVFLAICLYAIKKTFKIYSLLIAGVIAVVLINFVPVKSIVVTPFWRTRSIYTVVNLPKEYMDFTDSVKSKLPSTANIISFPQNIAAYAVITEKGNRNAYIGTSPFKFFTGINDLSGSMSYSDEISTSIRTAILSGNYDGLLKTLQQINVSYVLVTKNIPEEVSNSILFDKHFLSFQDQKLINSIIEREVVRSSESNYILYKLKNSPSVISSSGTVLFKKINPVQYEITVQNLSGTQKLLFFETYHPGWKLYAKRQNEKQRPINALGDFITSILSPVLFEQSHRALKPYGNMWELDQSTLQNRTIKSLYTQNADGSINIILTLIFFPQLYFYVGVILTILSLSIGLLFLIKSKR